MISHTQDGDNPPSPITQKHIRHCADCRRFYKTCQSLGERLKREAAISNKRLTGRLSERILSAMAGRRMEKQNKAVKFWIPAAAACMALIVLIGAMLLVLKPNGNNNAQPSQDEMSDAIEQLRSVYKRVGQDLPVTWPGVIEEPLANELESLTNDTQSAVRFLVACVDVDVARLDSGTLN
jgi:predicted anti-sigma-YlaC factor YlaD